MTIRKTAAVSPLRLAALVRALTLRDALMLLPWLTVAFVLATFPLHGASNDELVQHTYGELLWRYYASGLTDQAAFSYKNLYLYGGLFDLAAVALQKLLPFADVWHLRHLLSGLIGVVGLIGAARVARLLMGDRAAVMVMLLLLLTGMWSGAMFTHTKDVPFATAMVWALYYALRCAEVLPRPGPGLVLKLGFAVGCAIGLRVGAVLSVGFIGLAVLGALLLHPGGVAARLRFLGQSVLALLPGLALAGGMMAVFWPWAVLAPDNILKALGAFSHFAFSMTTIVGGEVVNLADVPRSYLPLYLAVKLPEILLAGLPLAVLALGVWLRRQGWEGRDGRRALARWMPVVFAALFPVVYAVFNRPPMYNGIRHFLFVVPPLAVLSAAGWDFAMTCASRSGWGRLASRSGFAAFALLAAVPLAMVHPYGYAGFNSLTGWLPGAYGRWEMDYWASSLREAALELDTMVGPVAPGQRRHLVAVCAQEFQGNDVLDSRFEVTHIWDSAEFFIAATQVGCDGIMNGTVIASVRRMGVPLAVIKDRRSLLEHQQLARRSPEPKP